MWIWKSKHNLGNVFSVRLEKYTEWRSRILQYNSHSYWFSCAWLHSLSSDKTCVMSGCFLWFMPFTRAFRLSEWNFKIVMFFYILAVHTCCILSHARTNFTTQLGNLFFNYAHTCGHHFCFAICCHGYHMLSTQLKRSAGLCQMFSSP